MSPCPSALISAPRGLRSGSAPLDPNQLNQPPPLDFLAFDRSPLFGDLSTGVPEASRLRLTARASLVSSFITSDGRGS